MNRSLLAILLVTILVGALAFSGCAYYNIFYNASKDFNEAEKQSNAPPAAGTPGQGTNPGGSATGSPQQTPPGSPAPSRNVPIDKYRKVIETCSKLLELYPKSRWVDDALFLMGVSYYRIGDLPRAERKFTELLTLFPKGKYVSEATLWKARTLSEEKKRSDAIELLQGEITKMHVSSEKAKSVALLGAIYRDLERWPEAAEQFKACSALPQPRADRIDALYQYGLCELKLDSVQAARDAFSRVARVTRDLGQAYASYVSWARCEVRLHNTAAAEDILVRLQSNDRFLDYADDIALESARLASETDRVDDAIQQYQDFLSSHENGTLRGLAFYRLSLVYRDLRPRLPVAKALLDSAIRVGATKDISDSARTILDQISKGLTAIQRITLLQDSIRTLEASDTVTNSPPDGSEITPTDSLLRIEPAASFAPDTLRKDSSVVAIADPTKIPLPSVSRPADTTGRLPPAPIAADTVKPSLLAMSQHPDSSARRMSPAAMAADSLMRALARADTARQDTAHHRPTPAPHKADSLAASPSRPVATVSQRLAEDRRQLQLAYLSAAEFYLYSLDEADSAITYYRLAASNVASATAQWKAALALAGMLIARDSTSSEALRYYRVAADADSIPADAANIARKALGLPLLVASLPAQQAALRAAEIADTAAVVSPDTLLAMYAAVVSLDSTSGEGRRALFAKAFIAENRLHKMDTARVIYEYLLNRYPDSTFVSWLRVKLAPPDSASVFNLTDAQLVGKHEPVEDILGQKPDANGWPPAEESLRGRRFR